MPPFPPPPTAPAFFMAAIGSSGGRRRQHERCEMEQRRRLQGKRGRVRRRRFKRKRADEQLCGRFCSAAPTAGCHSVSDDPFSHRRIVFGCRFLCLTCLQFSAPAAILGRPAFPRESDRQAENIRRQRDIHQTCSLVSLAVAKLDHFNPIESLKGSLLLY